MRFRCAVGVAVFLVAACQPERTVPTGTDNGPALAPDVNVVQAPDTLPTRYYSVFLGYSAVDDARRDAFAAEVRRVAPDSLRGHVYLDSRNRVLALDIAPEVLPSLVGLPWGYANRD